jgi:hypothetical protein
MSPYYSWACLGVKYLNATVFECHDITMVYHNIFYNNPPTHVWRQYSKPWYLVDMYKKLVIVMKTLGWSEVLNTPKIPWYVANHGIQNTAFYILVKHLSKKIPWYSSIPWFCLKTLKILCSQTPPKYLTS